METRVTRSRFQRHISVLVWKCYLQRRRRWGLLVVEHIFAFILFVIAVIVSRPVFLVPLQTEPEPPLTVTDILASGNQNNILGFAPNNDTNIISVMSRAAKLLNTSTEYFILIGLISGETEDDLNQQLYNMSVGEIIKNPVTWVIWKNKINNTWEFVIRSTERTRFGFLPNIRSEPNPHLRSGFLAIQVAVSKAILEKVSENSTQSNITYELSLVSMPVSPMMQRDQVQPAIVCILLCLTLALLPPVLETQALVVTETHSLFKRALRLRHVDYAAMYLAWIMYGYLTVTPICLMAAITLILIFRWIHIFFLLSILFFYITVMIMLALIMAMFHKKAMIACIWTILSTLLQTFLAELMVAYQFAFDTNQESLILFMHIIIPPIGLVDTLNQMTMLQTQRSHETGEVSLVMLGTWGVLISFYFGLLMLLQRTIGQAAIGGAVPWKSIIFKKAEIKDTLYRIPTPTGHEKDMLQEVDELVAKAISLRNVSKKIMSVPVLSNITLDIYRGEFSILFSERVQDRITTTLEDLLTGLTYADEGEIVVMGKKIQPGQNLMTERHMMGYCHRWMMLIDDLTVQEHLTLFFQISLWYESSDDVGEYSHVRSKFLLAECNLEEVKNVQVWRLDIYYRAQLCWAIALLLEPRRYRKSLTIVKLSYNTLTLEYGDRVFLFDGEVLVFGGTPAYMFFLYGKEYRIRLTFKRGDLISNTSATNELIQRASLEGATVRIHLGSHLVLMIPTTPTHKVAALINEFTVNSEKYGILSMSLALPDSDEVFRRAIAKTRASVFTMQSQYRQNMTRDALKQLAEHPEWRRKISTFSNMTLLKNIGWKYFSFFYRYRLFLIITILMTIITGGVIGSSFILLINFFERSGLYTTIHGVKLSVEGLLRKTKLMLRFDESPEALKIANAYVLSDTNATEAQTKDIVYSAVSSNESLTEYLVSRAIDSPKEYVSLYAYGIDISVVNGLINIQALYSPLHFDTGAAARSLARVYMALIRFYTGALDATIAVTDDPLALDLTPFMSDVSTPPMLIQFVMILTTCHITLLPSLEYGLVRHMQSNTLNFTPARYWLTLYMWDVLVYSMLVGLATGSMMIFMFTMKPYKRYYVQELSVIPVMMGVYGLGSIPLAYLVSLGPRTALNSMSFVIFNIVMGQVAFLNKIYTGQLLTYAMFVFGLSAQANMCNAMAKIKQTFLYNTECFIFQANQLCSSKTLHKCCKKCGLLQECFSRRSYMTVDGILVEELATLGSAVLFIAVLLLWEYRVIHRAWAYSTSWLRNKAPEYVPETEGARREMNDVLEKYDDIRHKRAKDNPFGEVLLAVNLGHRKRDDQRYELRNIYLGLGKGQVFAISGLKSHGRMMLCDLVTGYCRPTHGKLWYNSKWTSDSSPSSYARQVAMCCHRQPLPPWMMVKDGLEYLAILRGVPLKHVKTEVNRLINALEMHDQADVLMSKAKPSVRTRIHFAAAVLGAPPILVMDECTAYQKYSVRRAMYYILHHMKKRGHSIFLSSSSVESHLPLTSRIAILKEGQIYDVDTVDALVARYSNEGYIVVVHLKDYVDVIALFSKYFKTFNINDTTEVLVNVQVKKHTYAQIFQTMEKLQAENEVVYSYIVTSTPIDSLYNSFISEETPTHSTPDFFLTKYRKFFGLSEAFYVPKPETVTQLNKFGKMYDITKLGQLPWSVIFHQ